MTSSALIKQPGHDNDRGELREMFRQYLQVGREPEKLDWQNFTTREGLPHNWIYDLYQDSHDRIWAGTWGGGVTRFEGGQWKTFTTEHGLHCNEVTCIRQDSSGRIWLATDNGLNILDGDRITDGGLVGKSLLNITFDHQGHLWAGCWRAAHSGGGLFRYDGQDWTSFTTRQDLPGLEILKVFNDSQGRIWVGTYEQGIGAGVGCFDGQRWQNYTSRQGLANDCVYSMFEDPSGNMWFGTLNGVSIFDGKSWHTLTTRDGLVNDHIYSMLIDSHKKMWFGTEGGISRFDGQNWVSFTRRDGLVDNLVRTIVEARDGSLWFGAYPFAVGAGGISVGRYKEMKSLTDRLLDLLPEPPPIKQLPSGDHRDEIG
jgi:ligand-binding sensor domain-containing protein